MISLGASQAIEGAATSATTVTCTIGGLLMNNAGPPVATGYQVLNQSQLAASAASIYGPGGSATALISSIQLYNTGGSIQTVLLYINGTAGSNQIGSFVIPPGGWAQYEDRQGWLTYNASGLVVSAGGSPGGVGTPDSATTALTASSAVMLPGTLIALTTGQLFVGSRYRFMANLIKTAAGAATWTMRVMYGTNGTTADAAIATWTSGTNTGAIDQANIIVECRILTLGAAATAACTAFYVNTLTNITGFGNVAPVPGSTATFNSTSTSPFLHLDFTQGASAVVTAVGSAERLV